MFDGVHYIGASKPANEAILKVIGYRLDKIDGKAGLSPVSASEFKFDNFDQDRAGYVMEKDDKAYCNSQSHPSRRLNNHRSLPIRSQYGNAGSSERDRILCR
jgi:hypothetical protein